MIKKVLFRVAHSNGTVSVGPEQPAEGTTYTESYRLVADDGKVITDGENNYSCIDTDEPDKYTEVEEQVELEEDFIELEEENTEE